MALPDQQIGRSKPLPTWRAFQNGLEAPWTGFQFMLSHPKLWRYGILPILLNLLITGLLLAILIGAGVYLFTAVHPWFGDEWPWRIVEALAVVLILVVMIALTVVAWMALQVILCSFFYERLAKQVELLLGVQPGELKDLPLLTQAVDSLNDLFQLALFFVACVLVEFVPLVGTVLGLCGSYYFTCTTLGLEFLSYPLAIRGLRRSERVRFAGKNRPATLGLGTAVMILVVVPIINAVFLTTAVTGAVLLRRQLVEASRDST
jgi:CysZ protein